MAVAGTIEEVRTEADREVMRGLIRFEADSSWRYARADGARRRMLVYAGPFTQSASLATATTTDGEARVILDQLSATGFRLRFQALRGMAWATMWTEVYTR